MMSPSYRIDLLHAHEAELAKSARRATELAPNQPTQLAGEEVALRLCRVDDDPALERLAQLEGRVVPSGRHLVAVIGGEVVASLPLVGGAPLADPFRRTAHLLPLLALRAAQLENQQRGIGAFASRVLHAAR